MNAQPGPIVSGRYFFPKAPLLCLKWMPACSVMSRKWIDWAEPMTDKAIRAARAKPRSGAGIEPTAGAAGKVGKDPEPRVGERTPPRLVPSPRLIRMTILRDRLTPCAMNLDHTSLDLLQLAAATELSSVGLADRHRS